MATNKYSGLWTFFNRNVDTKVAVCKICNKHISYESTTTKLKHHLKRLHLEIYNNFFPRSSSLENVDATNSEGENLISDDDSDTTKILITSNSDIWDVFEPIRDTKTALCFICNKTFSYKSTIANLKQHLKMKHIEVYNLIINKISPQNNNAVDNDSDGNQNIEYLEEFNNSRTPSPTQNVSIQNLQEVTVSKSLKDRKKHRKKLWKFFEANHITRIAQCKLCPKELSYKSTIGNLRQHLKIKHSKAFNIVISEDTENQSDEEHSQHSKHDNEYNSSPKTSTSLSPSPRQSISEENSQQLNDTNSSKTVGNITSNIWQYFVGNPLTEVAKCNMCPNRISYKSTISNLKQHLRFKHRKVYKDFILNNSLDRSKGDFWNYFNRDNSSQYVAQCNICKKSFSFKSTTANLKQHLRVKHYKEYNNLILKTSLTPSKDISSESDDSPDGSHLNSSKVSKSLRSDLWNYFQRSHSTQMAKCNMCKKLLSFKSTTSNLTQHLRLKHHEAYVNLTLKRPSRLSENVSEECSPDEQDTRIKPQDVLIDDELNHIDDISNRSTSPLQNVSITDNSNTENWQTNAKSNLWKFFKSNKLTKQAKCNICRRSISYKTTISNLKAHLKSKHFKVYSDFFSRSTSPSQNFHAIYLSAEEDQNQDFLYDDNSEFVNIGNSNKIDIKSSFQNDPFDGGENDFVDSLKKIQNISSINLHKKIRPEEKINIDKLLLKMITDDFQPFSIVEDRGFKEFVTALNPTYQLPTPKSLSALLTGEYSVRLAKYQNIVQSSLSMSLSLDCWTSRNMQSYMAVTGHFVDQNTFKFCSVLLECIALHGQHTAERIASELTQIANTWDIMNKVNLIVSDNATNMVAAARILNWPHFACYARKFNLIIQGALNDSSITSLVTKVQKTVAYFKSSCELKQKLYEYQVSDRNLEQPKSLLLSVPTRWISVYLMLKRFSELQEGIRAIIIDTKEEIPGINLLDWQCIDQIVEVLKPFEEATTIMSAEGYILASKAVVLTSGLFTVCAEFTERKFLEPVTNLILKLQIGLTANFGDIEKNKEVSICTLLDPRFKQHAFEDETAVLEAKNSILEIFKEINKYQCIESVKETAHTTTANSSTEQLSTLWERFDTKVASSYQPEITEQKTLDELNMYISENVIPRSECPLRWWKERKIMYPMLSKIFISCFNTVVTSLPCDKAFSKTDHLISDRRTRLTTSKVDKIMFLHVNK